MEQTYGKRLFVAARKDFSKFWTAHRYWVTFVSLLASPAILQVARYGMTSLLNIGSILESAGIGISLSIIGNAIVAAWNGAKSLDDGLHYQIQQRETVITELNQNAKKRDDVIRTLSEKPKRTPSDQFNYEKAKAFLNARGAKVVVALRHLHTHGDITYSSVGHTMYTTWPSGMDRNEAEPIYNACITEGIVSVQDTNSTFPSRKIFIAPGMKNVLSELLYPVTAG